MMPFSSPWILNMFGFCSELLDRRGSKMNSRPWKWFKDRLIPDPDTQLNTHRCISLTAPSPVPCSCQDDFSFSVPLSWRGESTGATSALGAARPWGIPSVRKANVYNDICLKTLSFSWIHSVLSPWPLRPKECHLLIIQEKKKKRKLPRWSLFQQRLFPSAEDYKSALEDCKSSFKSWNDKWKVTLMIMGAVNVPYNLHTHHLVWTQNITLISQSWDSGVVHI